MSMIGKSTDSGEGDTIATAERAVTSQTSASVAQANLTVLSGGPAYAVSQSALSLSTAQGVLFANMVGNQYQQSVANNASLAKGVNMLLHQDDSSTMSVDLLSLLNFYRAQDDKQSGSITWF